MHILKRTPSVLRELLQKATGNDMDWQPSPDRWSISMVLAHLADVEQRGFMSRFRDIVARDNHFLPAYDQLDLFQSGREFDGRAELDRFEMLRQENLSWLKSLPESVVERRGTHEQLGVLTFGELLNEFAFHDLGHIRQVMELYRSHVFFPKMGVFQSYYKINP